MTRNRTTSSELRIVAAILSCALLGAGCATAGRGEAASSPSLESEFSARDLFPTAEATAPLFSTAYPKTAAWLLSVSPRGCLRITDNGTALYARCLDAIFYGDDGEFRYVVRNMSMVLQAAAAVTVYETKLKRRGLDLEEHERLLKLYVLLQILPDMFPGFIEAALEGGEGERSSGGEDRRHLRVILTEAQGVLSGALRRTATDLLSGAENDDARSLRVLESVKILYHHPNLEERETALRLQLMLLRHDPSDERSRETMSFAMAQGSPGLAVALWDRLDEAQMVGPDFAEMMGDLRLAREYLQLAEDDRRDSLKRRADILLELGASADAVPLYRRLVDRTPMDPEAWNDLAVATNGRVENAFLAGLEVLLEASRRGVVPNPRMLRMKAALTAVSIFSHGLFSPSGVVALSRDLLPISEELRAADPVTATLIRQIVEFLRRAVSKSLDKADFGGDKLREVRALAQAHPGDPELFRAERFWLVISGPLEAASEMLSAPPPEAMHEEDREELRRSNARYLVLLAWLSKQEALLGEARLGLASLPEASTEDGQSSRDVGDLEAIQGLLASSPEESTVHFELALCKYREALPAASDSDELLLYNNVVNLNVRLGRLDEAASIFGSALDAMKRAEDDANGRYLLPLQALWAARTLGASDTTKFLEAQLVADVQGSKVDDNLKHDVLACLGSFAAEDGRMQQRDLYWRGALATDETLDRVHPNGVRSRPGSLFYEKSATVGMGYSGQRDLQFQWSLGVDLWLLPPCVPSTALMEKAIQADGGQGHTSGRGNRSGA